MAMSVDTDTNIPLRLAVAADAYGLTVGALRAEARRGTLTIWRVAGKDWTSHSEIKRMFERCRVKAVEHDCGFEPPAETLAAQRPPFGSSETVVDNSALAAARERAKRLREGLPPTSSPNTSQIVANAA
ncbi:MAG TPA: excisionase [Roseiarcus sp.]|jgi:hypothetical protein